MLNIPKMKVGIVAVSRDCFPESLSVNRRKALVDAYAKKYNAEDIYECPICIVESEIHMVQALEDVKNAGCNALVVYLGNFGPEISETLLAKHFDGPKMFCAAAEENTGVLSSSRGDAYCGMLNASYNLKLRGVKAYIPEYPVGTASECADMIHDFLPIARAVYGLNHLKIITFGPRPTNFLACNAPIQQLYNLGVEIEENSELDLFEAFNKHDNDPRIPEVAADMAAELGSGNKKSRRSCRSWPSMSSPCWIGWRNTRATGNSLLLQGSAGRPSRPSSALCPATSTPVSRAGASPSPARWTSTVRSANLSAAWSARTPSPCWTSTTPFRQTCTRMRSPESSRTV